MARKILGYVRLEWTCRRCGGKNPGPEKLCVHCGASLDEQDQFELPETQELVTDPDELKKAQAGPDIHCPYCETRNPAGSMVCSQCGGSLTEGEKRKAGRLLGAFRGRLPTLSATQESPPSPAQPTHQPAPTSKRTSPPIGAPASSQRPSAPRRTRAPQIKNGSKGLAIGPGLLTALIIATIIVGCVGSYFIFFKTHDESAAVASHSWERVVLKEQLQTSTKEDWDENVPWGAREISSRWEYRETVDRDPGPSAVATPVCEDESGTAWRDEIPDEADTGTCSREYQETVNSEPGYGVDYETVCATPYVIDEGSGYGKVVQDCEYMVYGDKCSYTVTICQYKVYDKWIEYEIDEWVKTSQETTGGNDLNPYWFDPALENQETHQPDNPVVGDTRTRRWSQSYNVTFSTEEEDRKFHPSSAEEYKQFEEGSRWILEVNAVGSVRRVEPAR